MNYLIDTHILLWSAIHPEKLSPHIHGTLINPDNHVDVSSISFWEISLKWGIGKLDIRGLTPEDFPRIALETGYELIGLSPEDASTFHQLPVIDHRDPFARMLAWQAIRHDLTLITVDPAFSAYETQGLKLFLMKP